uniref:Uncharacterized protein n=1 Tax=Anguilla anguilla TaxID=7936 RepID=A0A0E9SXW5_ANGAN
MMEYIVFYTYFSVGYMQKQVYIHPWPLYLVHLIINGNVSKQGIMWPQVPLLFLS